MNKSRIYSILMLLFISSIQLFSQNKDHELLTSSGKIPNQIISDPQRKFWKDLSDQKYKKTKSSDEKDFLLENRFYTTKMLSSGFILFNDDVSKYLQKILNNIIAVDPDLKDKLHIYSVKSPDVNAYCTYDGTILINLGLVAQCEDESQIAFIICHEIAHFQRKHMKDKYFEMQKLKKNEGAYRYMTSEQKFFAKNNYSQEKEKEADSLGIELYLKTNYNKKNLQNTFDVIKYAETPFDEIQFSTSIFEDQYYKIPENYLLYAVNDISTFEVDSNIYSTHPEIKQRKEAINRIVNQKKLNEGGQIFLNDEKAFYEARERARNELSRLQINDTRYTESIYNNFLQLRKNPNSLYLKTNLANSLMALSKYATAGKIETVTQNYGNLEGEQQSAYFMMKKLVYNPVELCVLATRETYEAYKMDTSNQFLKRSLNSLILDLEVRYKLKFADFSKDSVAKRERIADSLLQAERKILDLSLLDSASFAKLSKYEKIRYNRQINKWKKDNPTKKIEKSMTGNKDYYYSAFINYSTEPLFINAFKVIEDDLAEKEEARQKILSKMRKDKKINKSSYTASTPKEPEKKLSEKKQAKYNKQIENEKLAIKTFEDNYVQEELDKKKKPIDIKKIVLVKPTYDVVNEFRENQERHIKGFVKREKYIEIVNEVADISKMKIELIDHMRLNEDDIAKFNDMALLSEIIMERLSHPESVKIPMVSDYDRTQALIKKYGTKYFMWSGVVNVASKRNPLMWIGSIYVLSVPIIAVLQATPKYNTYYYSIIYDLETGEVKILDYKNMPLHDTKTLLKNNFYNTLFKLKNKKF